VRHVSTEVYNLYLASAFSSKRVDAPSSEAVPRDRHRHGEVNIRASLICSINDVVANVGVILSGLIVQLSGSRFSDLIIGLIISAVVIRRAVRILEEAQQAKS